MISREPRLVVSTAVLVSLVAIAVPANLMRTRRPVITAPVTTTTVVVALMVAARFWRRFRFARSRFVARAAAERGKRAGCGACRTGRWARGFDSFAVFAEHSKAEREMGDSSRLGSVKLPNSTLSVCAYVPESPIISLRTRSSPRARATTPETSVQVDGC